MANFSKELPVWLAKGIEPPQTNKQEGWKASQKPPADWFNWFFFRTYEALKELQDTAALDADVKAHVASKSNPHAVTKAQIGLGNVTNVQQASQVDFNSHVSNKSNPHNVTKTQLGLGKVDNIQQASKVDFDSHKADKANPHGVTKEQVGLNAVQNYPVATKEQAESGSGNAYMTPLTTKQTINIFAQLIADKAKREAIETSINKNGDNVPGSINYLNKNPVNLFVGELRHYIGQQEDGTVIRIYFAKSWGEWTNYLDITVGGTSVKSEDGKFMLDAVTSKSTYITGLAPFDYVASKSVINGVEKSADQTIAKTSLLSIMKNGRNVEFIGKNFTFVADTTINGTTTVWGLKANEFAKVRGYDVYTKENPVQEFPLTDTAGKLLFKANVDFDNLDASFESTFVGYVTTSTNVPFGLNTNGYFTLRMRTSGYATATFQPYNSNTVIVNRREGTSGWKNWTMPEVDEKQVLSYVNKMLMPKKEILTPINGFVAESEQIYASYVKRGPVYEVRLRGRINPKGAKNGIGVCAKLPDFLCPDTDWAAMFTVPQQSKLADRTAIIYVHPGGSIEVIAIGEPTVVIGLDSISFETKAIL